MLTVATTDPGFTFDARGYVAPMSERSLDMRYRCKFSHRHPPTREPLASSWFELDLGAYAITWPLCPKCVEYVHNGTQE